MDDQWGHTGLYSRGLASRRGLGGRGLLGSGNLGNDCGLNDGSMLRTLSRRHHDL